MCNPHLETTWRKKTSHFQGTAFTQQESNYLLSFILHYHSYYFSKNCLVGPHHVLLDKEKNLKYCPKGTYHGISWSTSLESWKPYKMIRNSEFVYFASTIQGWDEWLYLCLKRLTVSSVAQSCPTLCDPLNRSTPGFPVHRQLLKPAQTHVSDESVMPSNLCRPLLLPLIFPSIRIFSNESTLHTRWPKYWSFSFSISPSKEYSLSLPKSLPHLIQKSITGSG